MLTTCTLADLYLNMILQIFCSSYSWMHGERIPLDRAWKWASRFHFNWFLLNMAWVVRNFSPSPIFLPPLTYEGRCLWEDDNYIWNNMVRIFRSHFNSWFLLNVKVCEWNLDWYKLLTFYCNYYACDFLKIKFLEIIHLDFHLNYRGLYRTYLVIEKSSLFNRVSSETDSLISFVLRLLKLFHFESIMKDQNSVPIKYVS